jgi:hypothetical protein
MDPKIQQQLLDKTSGFIDKASHTLGQTAVHVYGVLVRQQVVDGIGTLVQVGLWSIFYFLAVRAYVIFAMERKKSKPDDDGFGWWLFGVFGGIVFGLLTFAIFGAIAQAVQQIINPEYYAIKFIFDTAKGN